MVDVTGDINLNNANLTISGDADSYFIINVGGNLQLVGSASLVTTGGVPVNHILYNFESSNASLNTHVGDAMNGIFLAVGTGSSMNLDGTITGDLIGGGNMTLMSGAIVTSTPCTKKAHACLVRN